MPSQRSFSLPLTLLDTHHSNTITVLQLNCPIVLLTTLVQKEIDPVTPKISSSIQRSANDTPDKDDIPTNHNDDPVEN